MDNLSTPVVIGIAGGTACGKSTLAENIKNEFQDEITMISHDFYYKPHDDLSFEERKLLNYDHPNAFDTDMLCEHIKALKNWETVERPNYSYKNFC